MKRRKSSIVIALIVTAIFLLFAIRPGIFNMIGYAIDLSIFGENSPESIKYEKLVIYSFDILCGLILFFLCFQNH